MLQTLLRLASLAWLATGAAAMAGERCTTTSGLDAARVVELYTSEGCSSCPPADRWLSGLKDRPGVVAMAFHVSYWDRLGWKDRFASADYTQRQAEQRRYNGARYSYTPQVVVDGSDEPRWYAKQLPAVGDGRAPVQLTLSREGADYLATAQAAAGVPQRLAAYWVLTEDGHSTAVKAGENEGATLTHDFVVRAYLPVAEWAASPGKAAMLRFSPGVPADARHPRAANLVVIDAASGKPLQAVRLGC